MPLLRLKQVCFNDCDNDVDIANEKHFSSVYYKSASDFNAFDNLLNLPAKCKSKVNVSSNDTASSIGVSVIDDYICNRQVIDSRCSMADHHTPGIPGSVRRMESRRTARHGLVDTLTG